MTSSHITRQRTERPRTLWKRLIALLLCELVVLQPGLATAQVSQVPNFTVTGLPPNVMLMFDDSGSMGRVSLPLPPDLDAYGLGASRTHGGRPVLKLDTVNYFGIRGIGYPAGLFSGANLPRYDDAWNFRTSEVRQRAAAFNPLAYNPKIQYKPWNDNGSPMAQSSFGGSGLTAVVPYTAWDMRRLPTAPFAAPGATVLSKAPSARGLIHEDGASRSWAAPTGSVNYIGLISSTESEETEGIDLFSSTIRWRNPHCAAAGSTEDYGWVCPTGSPFFTPGDPTCVAPGGNFSTTRQCCDVTVPVPTPTAASRLFDFVRPPAPPPPGPPYPAGMEGFAGETCDTINHVSTRVDGGLPPCNLIRDDPPYEIQCPEGQEGQCFYDPPPVYDCVGTQTVDRWRCNYTRIDMLQTCPMPTYQQCVLTGTTDFCSTPGVLTPTSPAAYIDRYWPPARYVVYEGPATRTVAQRADMSNYRMVMIDRKFAWNAVIPGRDPAHPSYRFNVVDAVTGVISYRPDCDAPPLGTGLAGQDGTWCTFEQEAQNYANWYTYYRTRLYSSVSIMSDVLANFLGAEQRMRMGYGRINNFRGGRNPWNVDDFSDYFSGPTLVDGFNNPGGVERGVRSFLTATPERADVFKWLFSINSRGATPNREALHTTGRYFQRDDPNNPYFDNPGTGTPGDELWCRRNYTVLATDGEWTKLTTTPQPRIDDGATDFPGADNPISAGATVSLSVMGLPISGFLPNGTPRISPFTYDPALEPHMSGGSGSQTTTLSDIAHFYWSHDLRPEAYMRNGLLDSPANRAFWQHLATYIVGYGVNASEDTAGVRSAFVAGTTIAWPTVGLENCRQLDNNLEDDAVNTPDCPHTVTPSGNRINDTLRAALVGGGDFFSAASPVALRDSLAAVFEAINAENAAGTAPSFSNTNLVGGSVFVRSRFRTNVWDGFVEAYPAQAYLDFLGGSGPEPAEMWTANFNLPATRVVATSTSRNTATQFLWCSITPGQRSALDPLGPPCPGGAATIVDYLRGDQALERQFGSGNFRDRRTTILGDIVNSSPVYSKEQDYAYQLQPAASFNPSAPHGYAGYRAYMISKQNAGHIPIVMFGANDGMFHLLDATNGREIFAYVPRSVYPELRAYSNPTYLHRYTVDGPIVEGDVYTGGVWKTIAIGTTGAGPAGIFAIDITTPQSGFSPTNVLWDTVPGDDANTATYLGKTIGAGVIGSVRLDADSNATTTPNGKWAYIVGNGYESTSDRAALLVFDALNGSLIRVIPTPLSAGTPNGLGAVTPVYDGSRNIINVYAGDKRGNLWKFDLTSSNPANWKIANEQPATIPKPLFAAGTTRPIVQPPRVTIHPRGGLYVTFGTGKYFENGDPVDNNDQAIYAIWDRGQLDPIANLDVPQIRVDQYTSGSEVFRRLNATDLATYNSTSTAKGFSIRLRPDSVAAGTEGERIIAPMILDAGVLVATSFAPQSGGDRCIPGGTSFLYRIDLAGAFSRGSFGTEGAVTIGRRVNPGSVGSLTPVYTPVDPGVTIVENISAGTLDTMMTAPKYRMPGTQPIQQGPVGTCLHVGLDVSGGVARIPTNCVGLMPLRAWRPFR